MTDYGDTVPRNSSYHTSPGVEIFQLDVHEVIFYVD